MNKILFLLGICVLLIQPLQAREFGDSLYRFPNNSICLASTYNFGGYNVTEGPKRHSTDNLHNNLGLAWYHHFFLQGGRYAFTTGLRGMLSESKLIARTTVTGLDPFRTYYAFRQSYLNVAVPLLAERYFILPQLNNAPLKVSVGGTIGLSKIVSISKGWGAYPNDTITYLMDVKYNQFGDVDQAAKLVPSITLDFGLSCAPFSSRRIWLGAAAGTHLLPTPTYSVEAGFANISVGDYQYYQLTFNRRLSYLQLFITYSFRK